MSEPKMCSDTGPCWDGYVYIGPKPRTKGSCISKAKLCNKTRGKGVECKSQIDCSDWVVQSGGSSNSTLVKIPKNVKQEAKRFCSDVFMMRWENNQKQGQNVDVY